MHWLKRLAMSGIEAPGTSEDFLIRLENVLDRRQPIDSLKARLI